MESNQRSPIGRYTAALDAAGSSRPVHPPAAHCVAAANGWIVAAVDCPPVEGSSGSPAAPPLRLVSRWNVRRGTTTVSSAAGSAAASSASASSSAAAELLVALPPPVLPTSTGTSSGNSSSSNVAVATDGRSSTAIAHVFIDPTGCHVLASARNGEAYYLHSSMAVDGAGAVKKLAGFGPNVDGTPGCRRVPPSSSDDGSGKNNKSMTTPRQLGLTTGSYVTAVGWDRAHGTEGSSKRILLGTSMGEVYEFALHGSDHVSSSSRGGGSSASDEGLPVLLHRFESDRAGKEGRGGRVGGNSGGGGGAAGHTIVSGIHLERPGGSSAVPSLSSGPFVLVVTSGIAQRTRLHTFHTSPSSSSSSSSSPPPGGALSSFAATFSPEGRSFIELPGSVAFADLLVCGDDFSIKTETGLYYGNIHSAGSASIVRQLSAGGAAESGLLPYSDVDDRGSMALPTAAAMTPNHFILLCGAEIRFVNRVALKAIQNERVNWMSMAKMAGDDHIGAGVAELLMDSRRPDQVWLRKSRCLVHVSSSCETRDEWMYALQKCLDNGRLLSGSASTSSSSAYDHTDALFEHAASLCTNNLQKAVVTATRAEFHLLAGRVDVASKFMADCPPRLLPFDKTAVLLGLQALEIKVPNERFLSKNAQDALASSNVGLISYLNSKMRLAKVKDDSVSYTMIASWLASLHLDELSRKSKSTPDDTLQQKRQSEARVISSHNFFRKVLSSSSGNIIAEQTAPAVLGVMSAHDIDASEYAGCIASSSDIGAAISASLDGYFGPDGALGAIRVISEAPFEQAEPYYYKFAPSLLSRAPSATVKCFLGKYSEGLSPSKLLPMFMQYDSRRKELLLSKDGAHSSEGFVDDNTASVTYLEGVIRLGCRSTAVYNYLIRLYSAMEDEAPLHRFLSVHIPSSLSSSRGPSRRMRSSPLDMNYALRAILKTGRHFRSAVKLYVALGMRQKAVELAINVDPSVAREITKQSSDPEEQKHLWLMIARNAAAGGSDGKDVVASVASVLNECGPDVLSIENVLPFLPDFTHIDQLQGDICLALTAYSSEIEQCMKDMSKCEQVCADLRKEINRLEASSVSLAESAKCASTKAPVLSQESDGEGRYVFPSGHAFMESALKDVVRPHLNDQQSTRMEDIVGSIDKLLVQDTNKATAGPTSLRPEDEDRLENLQCDLDGLIAAECPLTGAIMIESIDKTFADDDEAYA